MRWMRKRWRKAEGEEEKEAAAEEEEEDILTIAH
jgi:hypothetical protein